MSNKILIYYSSFSTVILIMNNYNKVKLRLETSTLAAIEFVNNFFFVNEMIFYKSIFLKD